MKNFFKRLLLTAVIVFPLLTMAQTPWAPIVGNVTNLSGGTWATTYLYLANGANTVNSDGIPLYKGRGLGLAMYIANTNANTTDAITVTLQPGVVTTTAAGVSTTNWMTTPTTTWVPIAGGITGQWAFTNINTSGLSWFDNFSHVRITTMSNAHATGAWVTNLLWTIFP